MRRRPPRSPPTDTLLPYTALFRAPVRCGVDGQDHRGMNAARARYIFPRPLLPHGDETTFPSRLDGGVGGGAGHENLFQLSISRSGSSFGFSSRFGTCSARTTPMRFTASALPPPGSPAAMPPTRPAPPPPHKTH